MKNKNDKTAFEVICDRGGNDEMRQRIQNLFFSNYYISIIREDETVSIGEPQNLVPPKCKSISAMAGPMPKSLADDLYERLRSPRLRSKEEIAIRLSDDSKGIERIARVQCKQNSINWKEYWPFLDDYVDLTSDEGLKQLEDHLKRVYMVGPFENSFDHLVLPILFNSPNHLKTPHTKVPVLLLLNHK